VAKLGANEDADVRDSLRFLSITFGDKSIFPILRATAADSAQPLAARRDALNALAQGRDAELLPLALELLSDPALRGDVLPLLARFESPNVAERLLSDY